jgi:hypothetical protein
MDTIIRLYIYHYVDDAKLNCYGLIQYTDKNLTPSLYPGWKLYGIFYAFSSLLRPIPNGTKLFSTQIKNYFPYDMYQYKLIYNIFDINNDDPYSINFITYNRSTLNTKALYFHSMGNNIFPSFDKDPPNNNPNWKLNGVNPIYVMTSNINKFYYNDTICLPEPMNIDTFGTNIINNQNINTCLSNRGDQIYILQTIKNKSMDIKKAKRAKNILLTLLLYEMIIIFILLSKVVINF